jgi:hypothetical protein
MCVWRFVNVVEFRSLQHTHFCTGSMMPGFSVGMLARDSCVFSCVYLSLSFCGANLRALRSDAEYQIGLWSANRGCKFEQ